MLFRGDAPEGSDTFQWPVIEKYRVGGLRLIIWDKVKVPLCHYRVMHRKRVTSKLDDSSFRLMTIKHSISKIEWAPNDYITQLSSTGQWSSSPNGSCGQLSCSHLACDVVGKSTPCRGGPREALIIWAPEKILIRCSKESQHPAEWTPGLRLSIKKTRKTQRWQP